MNEFIITSNCQLIKNIYDLEILASKKSLKTFGEANLFLSKWPDYKLIHPVNSNIIFFEEYKWLYKEYYRKYEDSQESAAKKGAKKDNLYDNTPTFIKSIIKGRIEADKIGMPYGLYISFTNKILVQRHYWHHIPLACHLYNSDIVQEVKDEWQNNCQYDFLSPQANLVLAKLK